MTGTTSAQHPARGASRRLLRERFVRTDAGQASMEYVGGLVLVAALVVAVGLAFALNRTPVGERVSYAICSLLTLGQGDCGGSLPDGEARQPEAPCVVRANGDNLDLGATVTFINVGGNRRFMVEERSDGTFRVTAVEGGEARVTTGVGASTSFTIDDNQFGADASADISGGVAFNGGQEWVVGSRPEMERLTSADNWDIFDDVVAGSGPAGRSLTWLRGQLGIGETYPPPDSVYVEAGLVVGASAYAGAGTATAGAEGNASTLLGYRHEPGTGNDTYYYRTTVDGSASAELAAVADQVGAGAEGRASVMTAVTVDPDGNVVSASRSALATGATSGLTNTLFGEPSLLQSDRLGSGTQWDATLPVRSDADRQAVLGLLASSGVNPLSIGVSEEPGGTRLDPLGNAFMDAVRDRGELTRYEVQTDATTVVAGSGELRLGIGVGLSGGYETTTLEASNHEYWNGSDFASRSNC